MLLGKKKQMKYFWHLLKKEMSDKNFRIVFFFVVFLALIEIFYLTIFGSGYPNPLYIIRYKFLLLLLLPFMFAYSTITDQMKYQILSLPLSRYIAPLAKMTAYSFLSFIQSLIYMLNWWSSMYRYMLNDFLPDGIMSALLIVFGSFVLQFTLFAVTGMASLLAGNLKPAGKEIYLSTLFVLFACVSLSVFSALSLYLIAMPYNKMDSEFIYLVQLISGIILTGSYLFLYEKHGYVQ
jgi:hypothetical protein